MRDTIDLRLFCHEPASPLAKDETLLAGTFQQPPANLDAWSRQACGRELELLREGSLVATCGSLSGGTVWDRVSIF
jgi:hypothetical protein